MGSSAGAVQALVDGAPLEDGASYRIEFPGFDARGRSAFVTMVYHSGFWISPNDFDMPPLRVELAGYKVACRVNPRGRGRASRREALVASEGNEERARQIDMPAVELQPPHKRAKKPMKAEHAPAVFVQVARLKKRLRDHAFRPDSAAQPPTWARKRSEPRPA